MRGGDLGNLVWVILVVLGIVGKLMEKKGPPKGMGPVAPNRPGMPQGRPGQPGSGQAGTRPGQSAPRPGQVQAGRTQSGQNQAAGRAGQPSGLGRPSLEVSRPMTGQTSAVQTGRLVNADDDDEGVSLENVQPTVHVWQEKSVFQQPEAAPEPILQPIPAQQAVVWAEILGKPVALRGRRQ